jgi:cupin 2 domain-containing protein
MLAGIRNLFDAIPADRHAEEFLTLAESPEVKIERIVSFGQASPPGFWYDQAWTEWVLVLTGAAGLRFDTEPEVKVLRPGDFLLIPARQRHRVEWTQKDEATIWLAVHYGRGGTGETFPLP